MPFNAAGVYTNVAGATTAFPGQVIASATWNSIHTDVGTALTTLGGAIPSVSNAGTAFSPNTNDSNALGTTSLKWSDLFLASGAVINFESGDVTITHAANVLSFAGATNGFNFTNAVQPSANDAAPLGTSGVAWSDLFLASGGVINFSAGNYTITHTTNVLTFSGTAIFGNTITPVANDGAQLGTGSVAWSDLFLASGGVINWANGEITLTHTGADSLAVGGATFLPAAGTTVITPIRLTSGTLNTTPQSGGMEYDGITLYNSPIASSRAVDVSAHILTLSANQTGADSATAQTWFPGGGATGLTVSATTSYFFEGVLAATKTAGTTSNTLGVLFAGTATLTSIGYHLTIMRNDTTATFPVSGLASTTFAEVATNTDITAASTSANHVFLVKVSGIVRINGAGTFIPQFKYSAAPGGAPTIRSNTWFRMWPAGTNTVLNVGNWV